MAGLVFVLPIFLINAGWKVITNQTTAFVWRIATHPNNCIPRPKNCWNREGKKCAKTYANATENYGKFWKSQDFFGIFRKSERFFKECLP
jgi:hypothetical protein